MRLHGLKPLKFKLLKWTKVMHVILFKNKWKCFKGND